MRARALLVSVALASSLVAGSRNDHVTVEVRARPASAWVGQVVTVEIHLSIDGRFFERSAIQLLRQRLDLPIQVDAPWLLELEGARRVPDTPIAPEVRTSLAAAGELASARALEPAAGRDAYVLRRRFRMNRPGRCVLAAPTVRYAWATRFEEDFVGERRPVDRKIVVVEGRPVEIAVRPLPIEGRPESFRGAVGQFRIEATRGSLREDQSLGFDLRIEGDGDFASLVPPRLDGLVGLHVRGLRESRDETSLSVHAELVVTDKASAVIAPVTFSWFDPSESRYVERSTEQILVAGRLPPRAPAESRTPEKDRDRETTSAGSAPLDGEFHDILQVDVEAGRRRGDDHGPSSTWLLLSLCLAPWLIGLGFLSFRRFEAQQRRSRAGAAALARRVIDLAETDDRSIESAFAAYLAERLDRLPPAAVTDDLAQQLAERGVSSELAQASSEIMRSLVTRRYGADRADDLLERTKRVVRALETERRA